jgi:hypothetical protein
VYAAGGLGSADSSIKPTEGLQNSGNGGGGNGASPEYGGTGGSGIIIVRYQII